LNGSHLHRLPCLANGCRGDDLSATACFSAPDMMSQRSEGSLRADIVEKAEK
jgi:hypothetical protein